MSSRLEPCQDYVLLDVMTPKPYHVYRKLSIIVPGRFEHGPEDRAVIGQVLKKGPTCQEELIVPGVTVIVPKGRGAYLNPAKTLMIVREEEILAVNG